MGRSRASGIGRVSYKRNVGFHGSVGRNAGRGKRK